MNYDFNAPENKPVEAPVAGDDWLAGAVPVTPASPPPIPTPVTPYQPPHQPQVQQGDGTGGLIPYKNPMALLGYYVSVFGLIPCVGMILGPAAIGLGIMGLKFHKQNPLTKGVAHSWVAIVLGSIELLAHLAVIIVPLVAFLRG